MCGIVGIVGSENVSKLLLDGIRRLEYRGYDSVGMVLETGNEIAIEKDVGNISKVDNKVDFSKLKGNIGICHTRWATHGGISKDNAHPHFNSNKSIFAVHNGIIENFVEIKKKLLLKGYDFKTNTDSEIIPHYFDHKLKVFLYLFLL